MSGNHDIGVDQTRTDIDKLSRIILDSLADADEETLNTSKLKRRTGIDTNEKIRYRVTEKLEPHGLVESHQPAPDGARIPAKKIELTGKGQDFHDRYCPDDLDTRQNRLDDVERRINRVETRQEEILNRLETIETQLDMADETDLPSVMQMRRGYRAIWDYLSDEANVNLYAHMPDNTIQ